MFFPYGRQSIGEEDIDEVVRVLRGDYLTTGPEVPAFEKEFADYVQAPHAIACANGTAALHIICLAIGLKPGDQVIVPTISFVATANAPRYCGADVIFADVDAASGNATPQTIADAIQRADPARLKAIFVVHLAGSAVDMPAIAKLAANAGAILLEDACHATGTDYPLSGGRMGRVGDCQYSTMAAFSFHPVKTLTTGEGGAVTTRDRSLARKLLLFRNHGLERDPELWLDSSIGRDPKSNEPNAWAYELHMLGFNYRLTDFQAALGRSQLRKMPEFAHRRRALARRYRERFARMAPAARIASNCLDENAVLHLMIALFDFDRIGVTRRSFMKVLHEQGVGTQVHYIPIHRQPYYRQIDQDLQLDGAEQYYERCLSLPLYAKMNVHDVDAICDVVEKSTKSHRS